MTGREMIKKAMILCGYSDNQGEISGEVRFRSRALTVLNTVYADLFYIQNEEWFNPLEKLSDEIRASERVLNDIMPYGVAMYLAQSENDSDSQQLFATLYNQKRAALTTADTVRDDLPRVY